MEVYYAINFARHRTVIAFLIVLGHCFDKEGLSVIFKALS